MPLVAATAAAWLAGGLLAGSGSTSCVTTESYVYTAQRYDQANDCLAAYVPIETVTGTGARSTCPAACLTVEGALYVSTLCPPLPAIATPVDVDGGDDGTCRAALAAAARGGTCDNPGEGGADGSNDGASDGAGDAADAGGEDAAADADDASDGAITDAGDAG